MILDLLSIAFPNNCIGCKKPLVKGERHICLQCQIQIPFVENLLLNPDKWLSRLESQEIKLGSLFFYDKKGITQSIIHEIKYNSNIKLAKHFGESIGILLKENNLEFDVVIPVPLHKKKLKKRGYNQAEEIAKGIGDILNIPVDISLLLRTKHTETQTKKNKQARESNVLDAFQLKEGNYTEYKKILLVDDVITTGSTINECLKVLNRIENTSLFTVSLGIVKI
jgi:ComF family protein